MKNQFDSLEQASPTPFLVAAVLHPLNTSSPLPPENWAGGQPARGAGAAEAVPPEHNHPSRGPVVRHDLTTLAFVSPPDRLPACLLLGMPFEENVPCG